MSPFSFGQSRRLAVCSVARQLASARAALCRRRCRCREGHRGVVPPHALFVFVPALLFSPCASVPISSYRPCVAGRRKEGNLRGRTHQDGPQRQEQVRGGGAQRGGGREREREKVKWSESAFCAALFLLLSFFLSLSLSLFLHSPRSLSLAREQQRVFDQAAIAKLVFSFEQKFQNNKKNIHCL